MAKCFLKLNRRRSLNDGTYPIQVGVGYGTDLYIGTGISVPMDDWDDTIHQCTGKRAKQYNSIINNALARITSRVLELLESGQFRKLTKKQLKQMLTDLNLDEVPDKEEKAETLGSMFRRVIALKQGYTKEIYEYTFRKISDFCDIDNVRFDDINKVWLTEFIAYMSNLAVNTQSIHLRNLRNVFNFAIDEGITNNYPFRRFSIPKQATPKRSLSVDQLRQFIAFVPDDPAQVKYQDLFKLVFFLVGINVIDLCHLKDIRDGRIEYYRSKTKRLYSIKVEPEALEIISKYRGENYLLNIMDVYGNHKDFTHRFNENLQKLGPIEFGKQGRRTFHPMFPELTTYWARHTWATIAASLDIPKDTIAAALGHGQNTITDIYIDFDRNKIDEANRKVIDYVLYDKK